MIEGGLFFHNGAWWWAVALGLAVLIAARLGLALWRARMARRLADGPLRGLLTEDTSPAARAVSAVLFLVAMALFGLAALRPQYGMEESEWTRKGLDVVVALDMSASMLTRDVEPDRLHASVLELEELLTRLNGGRVGLVPFAGIAYKQSPMTSDFGAIRSYLRDMNPADLPVPGTAVGRALAVSLELLGAGRAEKDSAKAKTGAKENTTEILHPYAGSKYKVIVLVSDGEDHGSEPLTVARRAKDLGIRVYTIGVGDPHAGDLVPELDGETGEPTGGRLTDEETGDPVVSRLNEDLLKQVAEITGGRYFHYTGQPIAAAIFEELDRLEKQEVEATLEKLRKDRFQLLLAPGLALLALSLALAGWRRRGTFAVLLALLAVPSCGMFETTNSAVDEANERYAGEEYAEAAASLEALREKIPERAELHYDLGTAHLAAGDYDAALDAFKRAAEKTGPELEAAILANQGLAYLRLALSKEEDAERKAALEQAVGSLRAAIRKDPGVDGASENLELALLHLHPPCSRRQETYEPNNSPVRPTAWEPEIGGVDLLLCPEDVDHYGVTVPAGHRLRAWLARPGAAAPAAPEAPPGAAPDEAAATPPLPPRGQPAVGVTLELMEGASGLADSATLFADSDGVLLTENLSDSEATWTLRVRAPDDEEHGYRLGLETLPTCASLEDGQEDNDTLSAAKDLPEDGAPLTLRLCPGDEDWFRTGVQAGWTLFTTFEGEVLDGALTLEIQDEAGRVVATGGDLGEGQPAAPGAAAAPASRFAASAQELQEGIYYIRLAGAEAAGQLTVRGVPPCPEGDDKNEDDDTPDAAKPVQKGGQPLELRRCGGDDDWFRLELPAGEKAQVQAVFVHGDGDLLLEAYDPEDTANPVEHSDESSDETPGEGVVLEAGEDAPGTWLLRISGATPDGTNFYTLQIQEPQGGGGGGGDDEKEQQQQQEEQQQAIDQQMDQLDQKKRRNLEAEKALEGMPNVRIPGGKAW
ncbi:MAG: VWA domain-containing protein [Pseudomonadota bacterium]